MGLVGPTDVYILYRKNLNFRISLLKLISDHLIQAINCINVMVDLTRIITQYPPPPNISSAFHRPKNPFWPNFRPQQILRTPPPPPPPHPSFIYLRRQQERGLMQKARRLMDENSVSFQAFLILLSFITLGTESQISVLKQGQSST